MSKLNLRIQLYQNFEVDLNDFSFDGMSEQEIKKELIQWYFNEVGFGETEILSTDENSIVDAVQQELYDSNVSFFEVDFERELTFIEKAKIKKWICKGQKGSLNL